MSKFFQRKYGWFLFVIGMLIIMPAWSWSNSKCVGNRTPEILKNLETVFIAVVNHDHKDTSKNCLDVPACNSPEYKASSAAIFSAFESTLPVMIKWSKSCNIPNILIYSVEKYGAANKEKSLVLHVDVYKKVIGGEVGYLLDVNAYRSNKNYNPDLTELNSVFFLPQKSNVTFADLLTKNYMLDLVFNQ